MSWDTLIILLFILLGLLFIFDLSAMISGTVLTVRYKKRAAGIGAGMILTGLYALCLIFPRYAISSFGFTVQTYVYTSYISELLMILCIISFFLYAKINYGSKGFIAIIIMLIVSKIPSLVIGHLIIEKIIDLSASVPRLISFFNVLGSVAALIFVAVIFKRNKDKEKYAPKLWIFFLIYAILICIDLILFTELYIPTHLGAAVLSAMSIYLMKSLKKERMELEE